MNIPKEDPPYREVAIGKESHPERIKADQSEVLRDANPRLDCFASAEAWWSPVKIQDETHTCLPFMSFNMDIKEDTLKIAGPSGEGIGVKDKELSQDTKFGYMTIQSLREAARFVKELTDSFKIHPSLVPIFYSGKSACHVTIDTTLIDMVPGRLNRETVAHFANQIRYFFDLKTIDMRVYKKPLFLLRLVDSINTETGRYCVQLSLEEALRMDYLDILQVSSKPRGQVYCSTKEEYVGEGFKRMWGAIAGQYTRLDDLAKLRPVRPISKVMPAPPCHDIFSMAGADVFKTEDRIEAYIIARGSYDKDVGVPRETSAKDYIAALTIKETDEKGKKVLESVVKSMLDVIYDSESLHFSCSFMRMLAKDPSVAIPFCEDKEWCPGVNASDQQVANPPEVDLDRACDPRWRGMRIVIRATVAGITSKPKTSPRTIRVRCPTSEDFCDNCPVSVFSGNMLKEIPEHDEVIIRAVNSPRKTLMNFIAKEWLSIPGNCKLFTIKEAKEYTTYDLNLVPVLMPSMETVDKDVPFVSRLAVLVDSGGMEGMKIERSREFEMIVYPHTNPFTEEIVLQVVNVNPIEDYVERFQMTNEIHESLKIFQVAEGKCPREKWIEIYDDLAHNVLRIFSRFDMWASIDLVYHSLSARLRFSGEPLERGYMESILIGDTGQGKTTLARRIIIHYGLGYFCSGETAKRTGLLYTIVQPAGKEWFILWGVLPLHDKKLVFVDEFSGVSDQDKESLTSVRSSGIVDVAGAAKGKTQARTRIVFMTNSPDSALKFVDEYNYGCESVSRVFKKPEDVRRLDIANTLSVNDVNVTELNKIQQVKDGPEHKYTSTLCNKLILWAWSRKPDQVEYTPEAEKAVFTAVEYLSAKYIQDIPLLLACDLKNKIARGGAAVAARFYSTINGETLIVREEHIETYVWFLDSVYSKRSFGFLALSTIVKNSRRKMMSHIGEIRALVRNKFSSGGNLGSFCENLMATNQFSKKDFAEMAGEIEGFESFFTTLKATHMIERRGQHWIKSDVFKNLVKSLLDDTTWEQGAAEDKAEEAAGMPDDQTGPDLFEAGLKE